MTTHGLSGTRLHGIWKGMRNRCNNPNFPKYRLYGGRGICVCERWNDFTKFREDVGEPPSPTHSIDRYPNPDGNYEPGNVRWATPVEQARNVSRLWGMATIKIDDGRKAAIRAAHMGLLREMVVEVIGTLAPTDSRA